MSLYSDLWWYADGTVAADQRAAVFEEDQNTYASIFSDAGLTTPLANPTTTDSNGLLEFYAEDGDYWIFVGEEATGDSVLVTIGPAPTGAVLSVNGQTGVVTLDAEDVGAQPISTINAAGDLYVGTGNDATTRLPIGSEGEVLTVSGGAVSWEPASGGGAVDSVNGQTGVVVLDAADVGADPTGSAAAAQAAAIAASQSLSTINAKGDIYAGTANDTTTRLGVGSDGQVLTANSATSTGLEWAAPPSAPVDSVNGETGVVVLDAADVGADAAGSAAAAQAAAIAASQSLSTINAKGDLYAGTANDTTTRLAVGSNGQVLRANSATGTGLEWDTLDAADVSADPAGSAAAAQAASQPLDSDLTAIAALSPSNDDIIQRKAGAWTNRTIAQYKTDLAYTAAEVGAIAVTLPDAKGDILTATAADTPARLGVGSNGQVLTANSATSTGLEWATPSSGGGAPFAVIPRAAYIQAGGAITVRSSKAATLNAMYLLPIPILSAATVSAIAFELTNSTVGAVARLGFYASNASYLPDALIVDLGTFTADTTGARTVTGLSQALSAGVPWVAITFQTAAPNVRHCAGFNPYVSSASFPSGTGTGWNIAYAQTGVSGALPANVGTIVDTDAPLVGVKF